jgi:Na+-driven multidrug efflux pump
MSEDAYIRGKRMERENRIRGIDLQPEYGKDFFLEMLGTIFMLLLELGLTYLFQYFTKLGGNLLWLIFGGLASLTVCIFVGLEYRKHHI